MIYLNVLYYLPCGALQSSNDALGKSSQLNLGAAIGMPGGGSNIVPSLWNTIGHGLIEMTKFYTVLITIKQYTPLAS